MSRLIDFVRVYRLYRKHHDRKFAMQIAYDIAFNGTPF